MREDKKQIIEAFVDDSCEMAIVKLNGKLVMEGNFWDFHPGCHGITKYGEWKGFPDLVQKIYISLLKKGYSAPNIEIKRTNYKFEY